MSDPPTSTFLSSSSPGSNPGRPEFPVSVRDHRRRAGGAAPGHPGGQRDGGRVDDLQDGQGSVQRLHGPRSGIQSGVLRFWFLVNVIRISNIIG